MSQSRNDFQSLLSDFRRATNTAPPPSRSVEPADARSTSIEDSISQLWRVSRLRRETRHQQQQDAGNHPVRSEPSLGRFHLAICACIIDSLVHEPIWREFMGGASSPLEGETHPISTSAEMYIHAKYPERIRSPWVRYVFL